MILNDDDINPVIFQRTFIIVKIYDNHDFWNILLRGNI